MNKFNWQDFLKELGEGVLIFLYAYFGTLFLLASVRAENFTVKESLFCIIVGVLLLFPAFYLVGRAFRGSNENNENE